MELAHYYDRLDDKQVRCRLCPHGCVIAEGKVGLCKVRKNQGGELYSMIYGEFTSMNLDPIEKKPLYHFHPGQPILSIGTWGCNFHCSFCQNWQISQQEADTHNAIPKELADLAGSRGSIGLAYTYNEPMIWVEFVADCAREVRDQGMKNVLVTNGYVEPEPLADLLPLVDAMNIDLKAFDDGFYHQLCGGHLEPVKRTIAEACKHVHVELTTLVIPGRNDDPEAFEQMVKWIAETCGRQTPYHLSAYFPRYQLDAEATTTEQLEDLATIAERHLDYVYLGNCMSSRGNDTQCPGCGETIVKRAGYDTRVQNLTDGQCAACGAPVPIVMA